MESDSGQTTSIWMASSEEIPSDGNLTEETSADVCVVGAGIAGMTTAL
jgi:ribulose 1,5-bisphosphate synthetase/thiazole synthase